MRYLFFDTETTGLPRRGANPITNPECWPRMVQIAWMLCEEDGSVLDEQSHIIYPDGYIIPDTVALIHGITTTRAKKEGKPLADVLSRFTHAAIQSELVIGHNIEFDRGVVAAECKRTDQDLYVHSLAYFCTMRKTADFCKIPYPSGRKGNKWPKLIELHQTLFSCPFEDAHNALADVRACVRCYFELKKRGMIEEEKKPEVKEIPVKAKKGKKKRT
ncbi:MAG TPA: 3'-5' exonuclease [Methanospirillum sp.]|nr:3'-5' exonuclease [Methanospirillum sp.]